MLGISGVSIDLQILQTKRKFLFLIHILLLYPAEISFIELSSSFKVSTLCIEIKRVKLNNTPHKNSNLSAV